MSTSISNLASGPAAAVPMSPSQAIIAEANKIDYTVDAAGRNLGVRRFNASLKRRVLKAISAESSEKPALWGMYLWSCAVASIDGLDVPFPTTELQVDALTDRIGLDGQAAVLKLWADQYAPTQTGDDLKNS